MAMPPGHELAWACMTLGTLRHIMPLEHAQADVYYRLGNDRIKHPPQHSMSETAVRTLMGLAVEQMHEIHA